MKRQKIGLVLSGGGAKGAYEIGVYKALTELGVTDSIQAIAGTSVGALNTLLLECVGVEKAERVWRDFRQVDLLYPSFQQLLNRRLPMFSGLSVAAEILENGMPVSQQRLSELVDQNIQMSNIHRDLYAVAYNTDKQQSEAFHLNQFPQEYIKQIVLASANIPFVYDGLIGMKIGQYSYIDGGCPKYGTKSNTPISTLYQIGIRKMIVVYLDTEEKLDPIVKNAYADYIDTEIVRIIPRKPMGRLATLNTKNILEHLVNGYADAMELKKELKKLM